MLYLCKLLEKSDNNYKEFHSSKNLKNSLISMKMKNMEDDNKYLNTNFTGLEKIPKSKVKWKIYKWLIENRKENCEQIKLYSKPVNTNDNNAQVTFPERLNKKDFENFLVINSIPKDKDMINRIFWVFDEKSSGMIEFREFAFGLEMFSDTSINNKLKGISCR